MANGSLNTKTRKCKNCKVTILHHQTTRLCFNCLVLKRKALTTTSQKNIAFSTRTKKKPNHTKLKSSIKKKKPKVKSVSQLKRQADIVFSLYIRNKYADEQGYVNCVSCSTLYPVKEIQNGHYISRSHNSLRYSELNCFPQCVGCNVFKKGNYPQYTEYLIRNFGSEYVLDLVKKGREIKQFTKQELLDLIAKYKVKEL